MRTRAHPASCSLADDSGIEVAALDWGPGVRSARWGSATGAMPSGCSRPSATPIDRRARMVCALAVGSSGHSPNRRSRSSPASSRAPWHRARGAGGFGYDPIFVAADGRDHRRAARGGEGPPEPPRACRRRGDAEAAAAPRRGRRPQPIGPAPGRDHRPVVRRRPCRVGSGHLAGACSAMAARLSPHRSPHIVSRVLSTILASCCCSPPPYPSPPTSPSPSDRRPRRARSCPAR